MEIRLGRRADYAIRAALCLARHGRGRRLSSRKVADRMDLPVRFLHQIMADLGRAGVVTSTTGRSGGYVLADDPATISILRVVEAVEGDMRATVCPLRGGPCHWETSCALHPGWAAAQEAFLDELAGISLAALAEEDAALESVDRDAARGPARSSRLDTDPQIVWPANGPCGTRLR